MWYNESGDTSCRNTYGFLSITPHPETGRIVYSKNVDGPEPVRPIGCMAFDKHMNIVMGDTEEYQILSASLLDLEQPTQP